VYSVYLGVAEAARDIAVREAGRRREDRNVQALVGEMENELTAARLAVRHMIEGADSDRLDLEAANAVIVGRTLAGRAAIRTVEKAAPSTDRSAWSGSSATSGPHGSIRCRKSHRPSSRVDLPSAWTRTAEPTARPGAPRRPISRTVRCVWCPL
jgi:hypothetical protein